MNINNVPKIIGLTGANGAGKDTAAGILASLIRSYGPEAATIAFADALYEEVAEAFGVSIERLKNRRGKEVPTWELRIVECKDEGFCNRFEMEVWREHRSPRQILQWWGTEYRRSQQADYWVQRLLAKVQQLRSQGVSHIVITDVRFADEAQAVRNHGGQIWRIHRPNYLPAGTGHVSEVTGQEFAPEATITNESTLDALRLQLLQTLLRTNMQHLESAHA